MERVLITGAYGLLGRHTVEEFRKNGYQVVAFGRNEDKLAELKAANEGDIETVTGDLRDLASVIDAALGTDLVVHCGAYLKGWGRRKDFMDTNVGGTLNVLKACKTNNVRRLVYTSSPSAYALQDNLNITEEDYNEDNKLNYYIESKIQAEKLVRGQDGVPYAIIRPRGITGIGDENMLPVLIRTNNSIGLPLFEDGEVIVDLLCAANGALALRLCAEKDEALGQVYNLTNGEPEKLTVLMDKLCNALGIEPHYIRPPFGLMYGLSGVMEGAFKCLRIYNTAPPITKYNIATLGKTQVFSIEKAKRELGYEPIVTIDEMIRQYAEGYKKERTYG